jgi:predicted phosphodiesterase
VTPKAKVAIVAGDIHSRKFEESLTEIASKFDQVIAVYGNHEFYGRDISWRADKTLIPDNVHILDRDIFEYKDVVFIGASLWTDFKNQDWFVMNSAKSMINDFRIISANNGASRFTPQMALDMHLKDRAYIKMMVEQFRKKADKKIVVVTHFLPSYRCVAEKWKRNPGEDTLNYYFSATCDDLVEMEGINAWVYGHTHSPGDFKIGDVRMVANPLGYPTERTQAGEPYTDKVILI